MLHFKVASWDEYRGKLWGNIFATCWNAVFFWVSIAQCWKLLEEVKIEWACKFLQAWWIKIFIFLCHSCRILHLAIIHEEELIAQQLIQLFPKEVLDIQNNLYQVSATWLFPLHKHSAASAGIFWSWVTSSSSVSRSWKQWHYLCTSRELLFLFICSLSSHRDVTVGGSRVSS